MAEDQAEHNSWSELLRKMLPEGAPLPDEDQLDYSISVDYVGPSPFFNPTIDNIPKTKFATFPKQSHFLTPKNSSSWWLKSNSTSETTTTTNSDQKRLSGSSIAFDDVDDDDTDDDHISTGGIETAGDRCDHGNSLRADEGNSSRADEGELGFCELGSWGKGRGCRRCGKIVSSIWLLRGREVCIVCGAEYCKKCVLKAMGAMPEGRKCVGCIGKAIDEANRGRLGKGSRLLMRLCDRLEVKRIMQVEKECRANRVRPEQVSVNGRELREDELGVLLGCQLPPVDLKPGRYWYDKDSGLWGKEGEKPDRIISSKLDVGGKLQTGASRGNTRVYVNGREITAAELRVLKLAKVQCPRDTRFWLYEDGLYEEEGQNNIRGNIWEKASVRFISSLFSLPVPPESAQCMKEEHASFSTRLLPDYLEQIRVQKLLLLGLEGSGTSTIFKQAKFMYTNKLTTEELQRIKLMIQTNMYRYLTTLLEGREHFEAEELSKESASLAADRSVSGEMKCDGSRQCIYSVNQKIKNFSDWLLDLMATGYIDTFFPAAAREYAPVIDKIWKDPAIQETYKRRAELRFLPDVAKYFLDRVIEISSNEYEPSKTDILLAEGVTPENGLACIEFSFDDHSTVSEIYNQNPEIQPPLPKYQLIQLSSKGLLDGCKWYEMFEHMSAVILCVSLNDYDQMWTHPKTGLQHNKMLASRDFLESVATHYYFQNVPILLLLTEYNQFEEKIDHVPITICGWFRDFNPLKSHHHHHSKGLSLAHQVFHYIAVKFKEMYASICGGKLYVCRVRSHEVASVDEAFRYLREIIDWEECKDGGFCVVSDEESVFDSQTSSSRFNH